jgi:predicted transcriptional regulator
MLAGGKAEATLGERRKAGCYAAIDLCFSQSRSVTLLNQLISLLTISLLSSVDHNQDALMDTQEKSNLSELTVGIVSAYVSNNNVRTEDLAALISDVHSALQKAPSGKAEPAPEAQKPAVPIKKSVTPDHIISLENGQKFKSLKRHLMTSYGMTPDEYRAKWGLAPNYPMVAPNYAKSRSDLAKSMGLGRKAASSEVQASVEASAPAAPPKRRGRAKAASSEVQASVEASAPAAPPKRRGRAKAAA